eukprot:2086884-Pyramimonas_sp.AAC.1
MDIVAKVANTTLPCKPLGLAMSTTWGFVTITFEGSEGNGEGGWGDGESIGVGGIEGDALNDQFAMGTSGGARVEDPRCW